MDEDAKESSGPEGAGEGLAFTLGAEAEDDRDHRRDDGAGHLRPARANFPRRCASVKFSLFL